jgi:hypothetical protein
MNGPPDRPLDGCEVAETVDRSYGAAGRAVFCVVFGLLFGYCAVRVALQGEWVGAVFAGVIAVLFTAGAVASWRRMEPAPYIARVETYGDGE